MESFTSFFDSQSSSSSRNRWSYESLKNFRQISPVVQIHLKKVYLSLCCALVASAAGAYLHILWNIGGLLTTLGCVGSIAWLMSTPLYEEQKRMALLMAAALFKGASIGPLIELAIDFDPSIVIGAFVGCAVAFGCFSVAAMVARRREYLYLGGLLSSGLSILFWLHFASSIFGLLWAFGVCGLYCCRHPGYNREGTLWRFGLRKACSDPLYRFCCCFCAHISHNVEECI